MWTKNRYPDNWQEIATRVKERADWKCQCCGLQCLRPGEDASKLTLSERSIRKLAVHHHNRQGRCVANGQNSRGKRRIRIK